MEFNGNGVQIDTAAGRSSATAVSKVVEQMQTIIGQIRQSAETGKASWNGGAANAFVNVHNEWDDIAKKLNTSLDEISRSLGVTMNTYDTHDTDVAHVINQTMGGSGMLKL